VNHSTAQRSSGFFCFLAAAILLLAAFPAKAANLVGVRIGLHEKYTRVVLQTDARAPCWIASSSSEELVLRLSASSEERVIPSQQSAHLTSVAVVPADLGASEIRIALRGPVETEKLVLSSPHRIVLDLSSAGEAAAVPPTAGEPAATDAQLAPEAGQPGLATPAPEAVAEAIPEPAAAPPAPSTEASLETIPAEPVEPALQEIEESEEMLEAPAHPEPDPSAVLAAEEAEEPVPADPDSRPLPPPSAVSPQPAAGGGLLAALPEPLDQPLFLGALVLFLIFVIAFAVSRRRGGAEEEEAATPFAAGEPFSVDEQPGVDKQQPDVAEPQEDTEADLPVSSSEASQESSLFDQPVESVDPLDRPESEAAEPDQEEVAVALPVVESAPGAAPSQELEQRLAQLEERMDEMIETKDRLGRQISAQTEELRVQRAAIARTQRMLRDLTRPADEATEPVPKT
jgi:hypothetical protein